MSQNNAVEPSKGYFASVQPSEKPIYIALLISALFGLVAVFIPLCPVAVAQSPDRTVFINMIGAVNQTIGSDTTREEAFVPLLLYYIAAFLMAAGCMNALRHLKSAALFIAASAVGLLVGVSLWKNASFPQTDAVIKTFTQSAIPYAVIFLAVGALLAALASLLLGTDEIKKLRKA